MTLSNPNMFDNVLGKLTHFSTIHHNFRVQKRCQILAKFIGAIFREREGKRITKHIYHRNKHR